MWQFLSTNYLVNRYSILCTLYNLISQQVGKSELEQFVRVQVLAQQGCREGLASR